MAKALFSFHFTPTPKIYIQSKFFTELQTHILFIWNLHLGVQQLSQSMSKTCHIFPRINQRTTVIPRASNHSKPISLAPNFFEYYIFYCVEQFPPMWYCIFLLQHTTHDFVLLCLALTFLISFIVRLNTIDEDLLKIKCESKFPWEKKKYPCISVWKIYCKRAIHHHWLEFP